MSRSVLRRLLLICVLRLRFNFVFMPFTLCPCVGRSTLSKPEGRGGVGRMYELYVFGGSS